MSYLSFPPSPPSLPLTHSPTQFLTKNPQRRLGCQPGIGERQIKGHAFFRTIDWEKLEKKLTPPPFKPQVVREQVEELWTVTQMLLS